MKVLKRLGPLAIVAVFVIIGFLRLRPQPRYHEPWGCGPPSDMPAVPYRPLGEIPRFRPQEVPPDLRSNGFAVYPDRECWVLEEGYFKAVPPFITSDAVLYVFANLFGGGLATAERDELLPRLEQMVTAGLNAARTRSQELAADPLLAEPARRNVVVFAVASRLLGHETPDERDEVSQLVARVEAADETEFYPGEDWTIYRPRGAYADDLDRARYFRAMKGLGRRPLPSRPGEADDPQAAEIGLRQAWLLGQMLDAERDVGTPWRQLYETLGFYLARPNSFTPLELLRTVRRIPGPPDDRWLAAVRAEFAKDKYPASAILTVPSGAPDAMPRKYVQLLGERYVVDGQIHQQTCYPYVNRTLPSNLDIADALFGSPRARILMAGELTAHPDLAGALDRLGMELGSYGAEAEPATIYAGWLGAIRTVLHPPDSPNLPAFMRTEAWQDKSLTTALAAWTQVRHAYVLYAAETNIPACAGPMFYVEPVPDLYHRLGQLASRLDRRGFAGMGEFHELCMVLESVAIDELAGREPKVEGEWYVYLGLFGQWLLQHFSPHIANERPCCIVDVATDSNTGNVLHEATGPLNLILVEHDGMVYAGWVLSHYELVEPRFRRLTDEQWEKRVLAGKHRAARAPWTASYFAP